MISVQKENGSSDVLKAVFLEFLSFWEHWVFIIPLTCMLSFIIAYEPTLASAKWFFLGWILFLPQEYLVHVYILHFPIPSHPTLYRLFYRLHYGHHDTPKRLDLMFMPLWLTLPMLVFNFYVFQFFFTQDLYEILCMLCGLYVGYLLFEWTHTLSHVPYTPKTRIGQYLKRTHLWHHHHNEHYWFGVSLPAIIFDLLSFTAGKKKNIPVSESSRYLGLTSEDSKLLYARKFYAKRSNGDMSRSRLWASHI